MEVELDAFSLDTFERLVCYRQFDESLNFLLRVLHKIDQGGFGLYPQHDGEIEEAEKARYLTRFVGNIATLIADPGFQLNEQKLLKLLVYKRILILLFQATPFTDMNHLVELVGEPDAQGEVEYGSQSAKLKLMLTTSVHSKPELVLQTLKSAPRNLKLPYWITLLDSEAVFDEQASEFRNDLLREAEPLVDEPLPADTNFIARLVTVWMICSYFTSADKHQVKQFINRMLLKWMKKQGVRPPGSVVGTSSNEKPRLVVVSEAFTSGHSMYRCFGPSIGQLRSKFHTVLISRDNAYDEQSAALFDEVVEVSDFPLVPKKIIGAIHKCRPDVIYHPSLGMQSFSVLASLVRLAPVQVLNLGHPATSYSDEMDYVLVEKDALGDPNTLKETIILKDEGRRYSPPVDLSTMRIVPEVRIAPLVVRIAIPAVLFKLNADFLNTCKRISEQASRRVEFHFFPNRKGIMLEFAHASIKRILPDAKIYPNMPYDRYLEILGHCDLQFSTFPFGLTNGIVDSSLVGLPVLALDGPEVHSRADLALQKVLGLPDWLSARSIEEYEVAALRLIDDDELRVKISNSVVEAEPAKLFFSEDHAKNDNFVNLMYWIYRNHEKMQADGRKVWQVEDHIRGEDLSESTG